MLNHFIGKKVTVESYPYVLSGKLLKCDLGHKKGHIPDKLILQNEHGFIVVRSWQIIKRLKF
jgi:hypothetical protein